MRRFMKKVIAVFVVVVMLTGLMPWQAAFAAIEGYWVQPWAQPTMHGTTGTTDGIYDFGSLGAADSGGAGFKKQGDKFVVSNVFWQDTLGAYPTFDDITDISYDDIESTDPATIVIKAEGGSVNKKFTLKNMYFDFPTDSEGSYGLYKLDLTLKFADNTSSTHSYLDANPSSPSILVPYHGYGGYCLPLSHIISNWPANGYDNVVEIEITFQLSPDLNGVFQAARCNFNFRAIEVANVSNTLASPPSVTTNAANGISSTGAALNGMVNANGASTDVTFEYGTTTGYGTTVAAIQSPVTSGGNTSVSKSISGLTPDTTYHYRVVGVNSAGTTNGSDQTFKTLANPAKVLTADTTDNDVDHDIDVTFGADATFTGAITGVSFNGHALTSNQYTKDTVNYNKVTLHPSSADNSYLRTPGTGNVVISAAGYNDSTVSQTINPGAAASMAVMQEIQAPTANGGQFAQQPKITLKDVYGNICANDNSKVIIVSKRDSGSWTLTGTTTATATSGVAIFTGLGATNIAEVTGAQLAFNSGSLTEVTSTTVTLPAPAPHATATASAITTAPVVGVDNLITFTVKDALGNTDTGFSGDKVITVTGYQAAPDGTYGSMEGKALATLEADGSTDVTVTFTAGEGTAKLKLNKAAAQTIGFSIAGVTVSATNNLTITPTIGAVANLAVTQDITAPAANGGQFVQQPKVTLKDAYGNTLTNDNSTVITVSKKDSGSWTLTGATTVIAISGVATFTGLGTTNVAEVTGAQLAFNSGSLTEVTSTTVTLPAPAPHATATASADTTAPTVGVDNRITFTVKDALSNTDTGFSGDKVVTVTGYQMAPDGTYGSMEGKALVALEADGSTDVTVTFTAGAGVVNLKLNKVAAQTIRFSIAGVTSPDTNSLSITPTIGAVASMTVTQDITAPVANGGQFAQQPKVTLKDTYGNTLTNDNSTVITVSKKDSGSWTLTGTTTVTAISGVATFTGLGATNIAEVTGAQLAFNSGSLTEVTSTTVTLPAPAPHATAMAATNTLTPVVGVDNLITFTVKDTLDNTDIVFSGDKVVTVMGYQMAPDGTYGSMEGKALAALEADGSTDVTVTFTAGVGTAKLKLNKAAAQPLGFSIAGVTVSATNNLTIIPTIGTVDSMAVTQDITAPAVNGGLFAQQPKVTLKDAYGNTLINDNSTVITVSKKDSGSWTLTGTTTATVTSGVAIFTGLGATNVAEVTGARLAFISGSLTEVTSTTVTLPAPAPHVTAVASANTTDPAVGVDNQITFTVKDTLNNSDTGFSGDKVVTVTGYQMAPDGTYGSMEGKALAALEADGSTDVTITFTAGVGTAKLKLNKADTQTIGFSIAGVTEPVTNSLIITPAIGAVASMVVTQDITAPVANGGQFTQQPKVTLKDAYGNIRTNDSSTVITVSKKDSGSWTLTGTATATATSGVASFTGLGATNITEVTGAQLAFNSGSLMEVTSTTVTLPAPAPHVGAVAAANTTSPVVGVDNQITFTVKDALGNTDTGFSGDKVVTVKDYEEAPDGTYGSVEGKNLVTLGAGSSTNVTVIFTAGVGTAKLKLNKADAQTLGFFIAGVDVPETNNLTIRPTPGNASSLALTQDITAPTSNGGQFAQQPKVVLMDAFGNMCANDNSAMVTASKKDAGSWTLTGTTTVTAISGVAIFIDLGATNTAQVNNAQLAFSSGLLTSVTSSAVTLPAPHTNDAGSSQNDTTSTNTVTQSGIVILVNDKPETLATATTTQEGDKKITIVTVDDKKVEEKLQAEGNNATVTIPVKNDSDVVTGQLNGQTVKNMETKEAVLEIKTENVTYTLPASQISIDNVSDQIGKQVELKDIKVNVTISAPPQDTVKIVEDTANKNNYHVVVKPVEFEITCTNGSKTVEVSKFNGYVERMVAIPDGIDPSKITTGIVLNSDGTFSHVPTVITVIDGKYYAKINSLTNSTYSVIWSPKTFKDVEKHWAKDAVNDMGSRLVINGVGNEMFEPDRDITRGELASIIVKALGLMRPGTGKAYFKDVSKKDWYCDAISIAYENGIISGYGSGKFGPDDKVTREQAMAMVTGAMKLTKLKADFKAGETEQLLAAYIDAGKASSWAKASIASCIKTGVVSGKNGRLVAPRDNITRAEVAAIVQRLLKKSGLI